MDIVNQNNPARFEPIALSDESTVIAEFIRGNEVREESYQSEAQLEQDFIHRLQQQQYEYVNIRNESQLSENLRVQLERLNHVRFSDNDWQRFFNQILARPNASIMEKTNLIQKDHIQSFQLEGDDSPKNIYLLDKQHVHNNRLQVINQYEVAADTLQGIRASRYDVTILVNGLPLVHVELKRRGVELREAFSQISRYQRESFTGLFDYVQIFVISNGTQSKYYSNTTRQALQHEQSGSSKKKQSGGSFEFTSWWTDAKNNAIIDLVDFAKTFFARHTLLNILTRYCILDAKNTLLVMRPYQIAASEAILQRIKTATNHKQLGTIQAGGYIWHTTGSGKTLTSFKTAQLACQMSEVEKVLFVVDRKDLDSQTIEEYQKFDKESVTSNENTRALQQQLEKSSVRIVVTTIQKLSRFVKANAKHPIYGTHVTIIFDECHRSQFGDMHKAITDKFRRYHLFGFTGTPIFLENAQPGSKRLKSIKERRSAAKTTAELFGERLHLYTIVNAIGDKNVLPFKVDYVSSVKAAQSIENTEVTGIDTESALLAPERISKIVEYILTHFDNKTRRDGRSYTDSNGKRQRGFNSLFAVASIDAAKRYYQEFKRQQQDLPSDKRLKIALIYSFAANEEQADGQLADDSLSADGLDKSSRDFLEDAIQDYNKMFAERFDTSGEKFENYYTNLTQKLKDRELDMAIVVNMFLTGFDAKTLNTLWLDKNLKMHGLIQAYSRTNRILNSVKAYGNIVSFRNLEAATNQALALFGSSEATGVAVVKPYEHYYQDYKKQIEALQNSFALSAFPLISEAAQKDFIKLFGNILRSLNLLACFDEFAGHELLSDADYQCYLGNYTDLNREFRGRAEGEKESIEDDLVFEMELVKQVEVNIDYILLLVEQYLVAKTTEEQNEIRASIARNVNASPSLHGKKDLIEQFVDSISPAVPVDEQWLAFVAQKKKIELESLIQEERLNAEEARHFMARAFRDGELKTSGTAASKLLPKISLLAQNNHYATTKQRVLDKLHAFFERYFTLG